MIDRKEIDELIKMLDNNMKNGSGHINVKVTDPGHIELENISVVSGMDCSDGDVACKIPNLPMEDDDDF